MVVLMEIDALENGSQNGRVLQVATLMALHLRATEIFPKDEPFGCNHITWDRNYTDITLFVRKSLLEN